jgi:uncharacterized Ntn-hydrolase superfamily protein
VDTFSLVAFSKEEGLMGVAVQSHWFSVGSTVCWAEAGVGVVATQSLTRVSYGPEGLSLMKDGRSPSSSLKALLARDPLRDVRQVAMLNSKGAVAVHTGEKCVPEAGHAKGKGFSAQANLMRGKGVWLAMADAFREAQGSLPSRMLAALDAGQMAGGDLRGMQSAAILVVRTASKGKPWEGKVIDLRVEDHPEPLRELRRLMGLHMAYAHNSEGDRLMELGRMKEAITEYEEARDAARDNDEIRFWQAVALLNHGKEEAAASLLRDVFSVNGDWRRVLRGLKHSGLLTVSEAQLAKTLREE